MEVLEKGTLEYDVAKLTIKNKRLEKEIEALKRFIRGECYCYYGHDMVDCENMEEQLKELGIESYASTPKQIALREKWRKKQEERDKLP